MIDDDEDGKGFHKYRLILKNLQEFYQSLQDFLKSLKSFIKSTKIEPQSIIERSEKIISQLISMQKLNIELEKLISHCGWTNYFPNLKEIFDDFGGNFKSIFSLLIAICKTEHNPSLDDSLDKKFLMKLQNLLDILIKMGIFCDKIEKINKQFKAQKTISGDEDGDGDGEYDSLLKLIKQFYKARIDHHKNCCKKIWQQFFTGMPIILDAAKGENIEFTTNSLNGDITWEDAGIKKTMGFYAKHHFDDKYFMKMIEKIYGNIKPGERDYSDELELFRQKLIKKLYDTACNENIDSTYDCIFTDQLQFELDNYAGDQSSALVCISIKINLV